MITKNLVLRYCAPEELEMPQYIQDYVANFSNVKQEIFTDLREAVAGSSVLYVTRVQKERFASEEDYNQVKVSRTLSSL